MIKRQINNFVRELNEVLSEIAYRLNLPITTYPVGIMIEPSSNCNLSCALCPVSIGSIKREKNELTLNEFKQIMKIPRYFCKYATFWHFGEPFLNPSLPEMISYLSETGVLTQVSTNGNIFNHKFVNKLLSSGLTKLIISLDTDNPKDYPQYRINGEHSEVIKNIKKIIKTKHRIQSNTTITIQFLLTSKNENRIKSMKKLAKDLNADEILIKPIGIGSAFKNITSKERSFLPGNKNSRYNNYSIKSKLILKNRCKYIWKRAVICSDGNLNICCRDQTSKFILPNTISNSLMSAFNSTSMRKIRFNIDQIQSAEIMCQRCHETQKTDLNTNGLSLRKKMEKNNFMLK